MDGVIAVTLYGLGIAEIAVGLAALAYALSLVRDWRPMRSLREDNRGLREDLNEASKKISGLEGEIEHLKTATDVSILQQEHQAFAELLEGLVSRVEDLTGALRANTTVMELIARKDTIADALGDAANHPR